LKLGTALGGGWVHYGLTADEMVVRVAESGFRHVDYSFWEMDDGSPLMGASWRRHIDSFMEASASVGVDVVQAHSPSGNPLDTTDYEGLVSRTIRSIECCARLGCPQIVVHPGAYVGVTKEDFLVENKAYYSRLVPVMEATGVRVLVENIGTWQDPHHVHDGAELRAVVEYLDHPLFGACWDTGHGNIANADQHASIRALDGVLWGLHIQDNAGPFDVEYAPYRQDLHTLPFMGSVNFDAVLQGLLDISYDGCFVFEVHVPRTYDRQPFIKDGEPVTTLEWPSLDLCVEMHRVLFDIGKHMLERYDAYEG